ncbi:DoxX family protein [Streptomyces cucumeris]|uniref:DoxX family protein n=1 Tax=Streptomyces cucumeris TaxID=2962890 RepID=UPI003D160602
MNTALWIISGVLALLFVMAGLMKISQPREKLAASGMAWAEDFSLGSVRAIGAVEVLGALGLVLPARARHRAGPDGLGRPRARGDHAGRRRGAPASEGGEGAPGQCGADPSGRRCGLGPLRPLRLLRLTPPRRNLADKGIEMIDRRNVLRGTGAAALGALAITAVTSGTDLAAAATGDRELLGDPASTPQAESLWPADLTRTERKHLEVFDELDFAVYSGQQWDRIGESHAQNIRVHWPDGHYTDGIDRHIADMKGQFVWAPDTRITEHPIRIAKENLTSVTGVMQGTFTRPMPDGKGGFIQPTGKKFSINMATVGIWNKRAVMEEEFLFWDNLTFRQQIGLA